MKRGEGLEYIESLQKKRKKGGEGNSFHLKGGGAVPCNMCRGGGGEGWDHKSEEKK